MNTLSEQTSAMPDNADTQRRKPEQLRPRDSRTEWERDYARLIHSSAFRRLQAKTQVLGLGESDFYRTRLTHSMEVAQIGVGIVGWLEHQYPDQTRLGLLPDKLLISSICLAHDIGHPPFGHGGEVALNVCMKDYGGFEGNGQTLRILTRLDKYTDGFGLNPTRRMLLGVLKYPAPYSAVVKRNSKPVDGEGVSRARPGWLFRADEHTPPKCYLDSEEDVVNFVLEPFSTTDRERLTAIDPLPSSNKHGKTTACSLDTSIMDLADEISYSFHDLEDAISLGMIRKEKWLEYFDGKRDLITACHSEHFSETFESLADKLYGSSSQRKNTIGQLVNLLITSIQLKQTGLYESTLLDYQAIVPEPVEALCQIIATLVYQEVILDENVQQLEFKGQKLIVELFDVFSTDPERFLPDGAKQLYVKARDEDSPQAAMRVICDFIAGMSDDYATRIYEKIFLPRKGSIFDRL